MTSAALHYKRGPVKCWNTISSSPNIYFAHFSVFPFGQSTSIHRYAISHHHLDYHDAHDLVLRIGCARFVCSTFERVIVKINRQLFTKVSPPLSKVENQARWRSPRLRWKSWRSVAKHFTDRPLSALSDTLQQYQYTSASSIYLSSSTAQSQQPTAKSASSDAEGYRTKGSQNISILAVFLSCTAMAHIFEL